MVHLHAGGRRLARAIQRVRSWPLTAALAVALLLAGGLGQSSLVTAQQALPGPDPGFFPATGYRISSPTALDYFQHRGGVRTFGYPVSNEFPLLGKRVQLFQRQMLEVSADGSVTPANILDPDVMPITHIDGLSLPPADQDLLGSAPTPDSSDYATQALAFINVYVPDEWNGQTVNFQSTFLNSVTCADAFGTDPCDPSLLPAFALELWGLPTSLPMTDPLNNDFVYQRFQRGIMHFSRATGNTQGLLLGDWLKRIMIGVDLSPDIDVVVRHSRFFAQYAPSRPLALDRPTDLPDTSLAQAFRADTLNVAQAQTTQTLTVEPTLPINVAQTATAVAMTATAISGTQSSLQSTQGQLTATAAALTATAAAISATQTPTPGSVVSNIPVVNLGCMGDEQMWFVPRKPNIGTHVSISVTSQRHHDARAIVLSGPLDPGPVTERVGPLGFIWTWTVAPVVEDFHQWTFYADGLRPCITSGFNAYAPLGATATPTVTPVATNTPGTATATPTNTPVPAPVVTGVSNSNSLTCGELISITGANFGSPPSSIGTNTILTNGATTFTLSQVGTGSNTSLRVTTPPTGSGIDSTKASSIVVTNSGGDSTPFTVKFTGSSNATPGTSSSC